MTIPVELREKLLKAVKNGVHDGKGYEGGGMGSCDRTILELAESGCLLPVQLVGIYGKDLTAVLAQRKTLS